MRVADFEFELPEELIALRPAVPRDASRLLVVRENGAHEHRFMRNLPELLDAGDVLVLNDTKVVAARLKGMRGPRDELSAGAKIEVLLLKPVGSNGFRALARPAKRLRQGDRIAFQNVSAEIVSRGEGGEIELMFDKRDRELLKAIDEEGETPLPPYIAGKRKADARDIADYQTIYAHVPGSIAAPTAGLHFTHELFARLKEKAIARQSVTLHVGAGTFLPVASEDTEDHRMHAEIAELSPGTAAALNAARVCGKRIVAVGTTALRTLETAADDAGVIHPYSGETALFITPGYRFKAVDALITNFHLPRSTLFMLVSAFSGIETMKAAYEEAIAARYRFYSYGDACLLFRPQA